MSYPSGEYPAGQSYQTAQPHLALAPPTLFDLLHSEIAQNIFSYGGEDAYRRYAVQMARLYLDGAPYHYFADASPKPAAANDKAQPTVQWIPPPMLKGSPSAPRQADAVTDDGNRPVADGTRAATSVRPGAVPVNVGGVSVAGDFNVRPAPTNSAPGRQGRPDSIRVGSGTSQVVAGVGGAPSGVTVKPLSNANVPPAPQPPTLEPQHQASPADVMSAMPPNVPSQYAAAWRQLVPRIDQYAQVNAERRSSAAGGVARPRSDFRFGRALKVLSWHVNGEGKRLLQRSDSARSEYTTALHKFLDQIPDNSVKASVSLYVLELLEKRIQEHWLERAQGSPNAMTPAQQPTSRNGWRQNFRTHLREMAASDRLSVIAAIGGAVIGLVAGSADPGVVQGGGVVGAALAGAGGVSGLAGRQAQEEIRLSIADPALYAEVVRESADRVAQVRAHLGEIALGDIAASGQVEAVTRRYELENAQQMWRMKWQSLAAYLGALGVFFAGSEAIHRLVFGVGWGAPSTSSATLPPAPKIPSTTPTPTPSPTPSPTVPPAPTPPPATPPPTPGTGSLPYIPSGYDAANYPWSVANLIAQHTGTSVNTVLQRAMEHWSDIHGGIPVQEVYHAQPHKWWIEEYRNGAWRALDWARQTEFNKAMEALYA